MENKPLQLTSYNLEEVTKQLIMHLMTNYPKLGRKGVANQLGVSERTLYRYFKEYDMDVPRRSSDVSVPSEVKQKVRALQSNFPHMKRNEIELALMRHYDENHRVVTKWLDGLNIRD